jgi:predicted glycosyltransferase involved in capsule biosynthesis
VDLSVLIPYGGDEEWRERNFHWLLRRYGDLLPGAQIVIGSSDEPFSRARARNQAFSQCTGDTLLIADADTLFHVDQIEAAVQLLHRRRTWVIPYTWYYNLSREVTNSVLNLDPTETILEPTSTSSYEHKVESWAGLLVMSRTAFELVGGYDERFQGWGYEDNAFRLALDTLWGPHERVGWGYCLHLWHPAPESECFGQPNIDANRALFRDYEAAHGDPIRMRAVVR